AATRDGGIGVVTVHLGDVELDQPIRDQHAGSRADHAQEWRVVDADEPHLRRHRRWYDAYARATRDRYRVCALRQRTRPDLEPLQIEEDRHPAPQRTCRLAHRADECGSLFVAAVR